MRTTYFAFRYTFEGSTAPLHLSINELSPTDEAVIPMGTIIIDTSQLQCSEEVFLQRVADRKLKCAEAKVAKARRELMKAEDHLASLLALPSKG